MGEEILLLLGKIIVNVIFGSPRGLKRARIHPLDAICR